MGNNWAHLIRDVQIIAAHPTVQQERPVLMLTDESTDWLGYLKLLVL